MPEWTKSHYQRTELVISLFSATCTTGCLHFWLVLPELCRIFLKALASLIASFVVVFFFFFLVIHAKKFMCIYKKGLTSPEIIENI